MASPIDVRIFDSEKQVSDNVCAAVLERAEQAISDKEIFSIGVSGGSMAKFLCQGLARADTDWEKWRVFFCDERHVPFNHADSTYKYYKENLMSEVPLSDVNVFKINPEKSVTEAAWDYAETIKYVLNDDCPKFDVLLLGMGPDGHTCSLFPGHPLLQEEQKIVAAISDSPKPPPCRVTMTFKLINQCKLAIFAACGEGKAEIVKDVLEGNPTDPLPAAMVRPKDGTVSWFLDKPAASKLQKS